MSEELEFIIRAGLIGIGATGVMDLWAIFLKQAFAIPSLNYAMVGRWIGHLPRGHFIHETIAKTPPVRGEAILGWGAHYTIGIVFAAVLIAIQDLDWARHPTLLPALIVGIATVVFPFFVLQPGLGAGIAASKTPTPNISRLRSLMAHASFGVGLYLAALVVSGLWPV
jgi:hypothetical protein